MLPRQNQRKLKSFALQRGLYVVRSDTAADLAQPPLVTFNCTPGINEVISPPDQPYPTMSAPGQALVIRAIESGNVQVEISTASGFATLDATLKFEQLRASGAAVGTTMAPHATPVAPAASPAYGYPPQPAPAAASAPAAWPGYAYPPPQAQGTEWGAQPLSPLASPPPVPVEAPRGLGMPAYLPPQAAMAPVGAAAHGLQVLAHLARLGDVTVAPDQWLGGPAAPTRIEGFMLKWPTKPNDLGIRYSAVVAGQRPAEVRSVDAGEFAGTRGKGRPVLGIAMELSGPAARQYTIVAECMFLGAPAKRVSGTSISVSGPSGREPLVGLKLAIVAQAAEQPAVAAPASGGRLAPQQPASGQPANRPTLAPSAPPAQPLGSVFRA